MRKFYPLYTCLLLSMLVMLSQAQVITNGSFEQWSGGNPTGWKTSNSPPTWTNIIQSSSAHSGSASAEGSVVLAFGTPVSPSLLAGTNGNGFPISSRPAALHGWYKLTPVGGDGFSVSVVLSKNSSGIGAGLIADATPVSVYREFVVDFMYTSGETPDTVEIAIAVFPLAGGYHAGTVFTVDDLAWGPASDVKEIGGTPSSFALEQNYPNPFNPTTNIEFQVAERSFLSLKVFDMLGREVTQLVSEELMPGKYRAVLNGATLPSGSYFYQLQAGRFVATKKLVILK
jgi:hypothetical protein